MSTCHLCDLPLPSEPVGEPDAEVVYCCKGCREVDRAIDDIDSEQLELERDTVSTVELDDIPDGYAETFFSVSGMICTTCEAFLRHRGKQTEGVQAIDANYGISTARVVYDPNRWDVDALADTLSGHGYELLPRDDDRAHTSISRRRSDSMQRIVVGGFFTMLIMPWYFFYLYPGYVGIETGLLDVDTTTTVGLYLPMLFIGVMTTIVLFFTGKPILRGAWVSLRTRQPNMDLLVSVAAVAAYAYSTIALAMGSTHLYYDVSVMIVMIVTVGRYYEDSIRSSSMATLTDLTYARTSSAIRLTESGREEVPLDHLEAGEEVVVPAGERIPVDGKVVDGMADVDESIVSGESLPIAKEPGDEVLGGSTVLDDAVVVEVGPDATSTVNRIVRSLWEIQSSRPGVQRFADALATIFVPVVLILGLAITLYQLAVGATTAAAILAGLTVLVVSCPCAMGLATPMAISAGLRDALTSGLVVMNEAVFEVAPTADTVIFDKTGTLTTGEMSVSEVIGHEDTLSKAAAVEYFVSHPIAEAIVSASPASTSAAVTDGGVPTADDGRDDDVERSRQVPSVHEFSRHPGRGVSGRVGEHDVVVGTASLVEERCGPIPAEIRDAAASIDDEGAVPVVVGWEGRARGLIRVEDSERDDWIEAIEHFGEQQVVVLTGDEGASADRYRAHPGVDTVLAGVPPEGKLEAVRGFAAAGSIVMVGDGTNDAPALAEADLGIALGGGTASAADAADVVIASNELNRIRDVFSLADGTKRRIRENIGWALLYNAIAIPLAVFGMINPLFAAVAMAISSIIVVTNSRRPVFR